MSRCAFEGAEPLAISKRASPGTQQSPLLDHIVTSHFGCDCSYKVRDESRFLHVFMGWLKGLPMRPTAARAAPTHEQLIPVAQCNPVLRERWSEAFATALGLCPSRDRVARFALVSGTTLYSQVNAKRDEDDPYHAVDPAPDGRTVQQGCELTHGKRVYAQPG